MLYFFFQAEDGIRDRNVTGVQTCALPIFGGGTKQHQCQRQRRVWRRFGGGSEQYQREGQWWGWRRRSEERRVGKECRSGWGGGRVKKREGQHARDESSELNHECNEQSRCG